jgi:hypothetical protein
MSDKDRQKKDGQRKDKKNQAQRESVSERGQASGQAKKRAGAKSTATKANKGTR